MLDCTASTAELGKTAGKDAEQVNAEAKEWIDRKMQEISPAYRNTANGGAAEGTA